jgi:hypothetical protein
MDFIFIFPILFVVAILVSVTVSSVKQAEKQREQQKAAERSKTLREEEAMRTDSRQASMRTPASKPESRYAGIADDIKARGQAEQEARQKLLNQLKKNQNLKNSSNAPESHLHPSIGQSAKPTISFDEHEWHDPYGTFNYELEETYTGDSGLNCEHDRYRAVQVESFSEDESSNLARYIVFSELIGKPKSARHR